MCVSMVNAKAKETAIVRRDFRLVNTQASSKGALVSKCRRTWLIAGLTHGLRTGTDFPYFPVCFWEGGGGERSFRPNV